jgi:hypothetical protein
LRFADKDGHWQSHAYSLKKKGNISTFLKHEEKWKKKKKKRRKKRTSLASRAKSGSSQCIERALLVRVRQNDAVILCRHVRLHAFAVRGTARVDVVADLASADKRDGLDARIVADEVDSFLAREIYKKNCEKKNCEKKKKKKKKTK